jgi:hypothetical protein
LVESAAKMFEEQEEERREGADEAASEDQEAWEEDATDEGCPAEMYEGRGCGRSIHSAPAHDATPVCLMHSRDPEKSEEAFQKEPAYQPVRAGGRLLTLAETLLTSSLAALFFLAMRRQFRR